MSTMDQVEEPIQKTVYNDMQRLNKVQPRRSILGKEFLIYSDVFHPDTFGITEFINVEILETVKGELMKKSEDASFEFLEVGCGAGYTAILAALASQKCKVWATDINDNAVKNTIENAKLHGVDDQLIAVTADVFDHKEIAGKEFDMIYWNIPWFVETPEPGTELEVLMHSVVDMVDTGYHALYRFLSQARLLIRKTGRIFVAFSFNLGSKELFERVVSETGWVYKISCTNVFLAEIGGKQLEIEVSIVEFFEQN